MDQRRQLEEKEAVDYKENYEYYKRRGTKIAKKLATSVKQIYGAAKERVSTVNQSPAKFDLGEYLESEAPEAKVKSKGAKGSPFAMAADP